jgi:hypothetical protein
MSELQPIGHRLFVAFSYRHLPPPNRKRSPTRSRDLVGIRHKCRSVIAGRCQDPPYSANLPSSEMTRSVYAAGSEFARLAPCLAPQRWKGNRSRRPPGKGGIARDGTPQVLTVASSRSADRSRATAVGWGQAAAVDIRRAGRRCLPRGASSPMRQGVTDTRRSLRILADYPSETAQVTGTERLTWPSAARRRRRLGFCQVPLGFAQRTRFQRYRKRLVRPSPSVSSMCSAVYLIMRESPCLAPGSTT